MTLLDSSIRVDMLIFKSQTCTAQSQHMAEMYNDFPVFLQFLRAIHV